jgi:peroxiredoxin
MKFLSLLALLFPFTSVLMAQEGYKISVDIEGYDQEILTMANNILDKQYLVDTAYRTEDGSYLFVGDEALPAGIYLVVTQPDNNYFQMLIGADGDQQFSLSTQLDNLGKVVAKGSQENELFFEYMGFLNDMQEESKPLVKILRDSTTTDARRDEITQEMEGFDLRVKAKQDDIIKEHPASFVAAIIRTNQSNNPPEYPEIADETERRTTQLKWLQEHYFDPIDLKDERLLRTPFLFNRIEYFVDKLHIQHPDTVSKTIDGVLDLMDPKSEMFKYYVVHFINKAAASKIVGMDAVYVHMVDNYYSNGRAYWTDEEQLKSMQENAERTRPLLIGNQAPNMKMSRRDGTPVELYELEANYTILYFWQFACPSCKKSTPYMKEFYEKWKDKGVEIFSICTKQGEIGKCWEYIDDNGIGEWLHATDRYMRFYKDYDIRSTPSIFVLDENKKIVSKRIGAQQLDELLTALERQKELEAEASGK